jgi:uncharacterized protein (DUF58 family)
VKPAPYLIALLIGWAAVGALALAALVPLGAFWGCGALILAVAAGDAVGLRASPSPTVERVLPAVVPVGVERGVMLRLRHPGPATLRVEAHDLHPGDWPVAGLPRRVAVPPGRELAFEYHLTPLTRGQHRFEGCDVGIESPLRLWRQRRRIAAAQSLRVCPNFAPLAKLALVGAEQASRVIGAHLRRRRGEGTEFQQLREYRVGDSLRQIDWKASQRARKLISREYQDETNQRVMLLIDTGRRMLARDGELAHFDHVLNAALLVAHIALRRGDAVGLLAAGDSPRFLPPRRGPGTVDALVNAVYDLEPRAVATDYLEAATLLELRQSRRCLVLLVTNARDEDVDDLIAAVRQLRRRHLVCVASLREQVIDRVLEAPVHGVEDALRLAAMNQYAEHRAQAHGALRAQGCDVLDVTCTELPAALVEHYLAIKQAARL